MIQEYLAGPEYTIDVLCDTRGRAVSIVPRERVVIRAGVIDCGRTVKTSALIRRLAAEQCGACRRTHPSHRPAERGEPRALKARSLKPS